MAGYPGTPLLAKLGIAPGGRVAIEGDDLRSILLPLPEGVDLLTLRAGKLDVIVLAARSEGALGRRLPQAARRLQPAGAVWVCWPKRASGEPTDIVEDTVRRVALPYGLVDTKVAAIDHIWSGLRLVVRKEHRANWPARLFGD